MPTPITLQQLTGIIDTRRRTISPLIITISGPSSSGKSTLLDMLQSRYPGACTTISTDDYYIGKSRMKSVMPAGHQNNFDHPAAIKTELSASHLAQLIRGDAIQQPRYDMATSEPLPEHVTTIPTPIIIVEGLAANLPPLRALSHLSVVLTAPASERLKRRIARDITRKHYTPAQIRHIFLTSVEPNYQTYFAPHDNAAEYVITS